MVGHFTGKSLTERAVEAIAGKDPMQARDLKDAREKLDRAQKNAADAEINRQALGNTPTQKMKPGPERDMALRLDAQLKAAREAVAEAEAAYQQLEARAKAAARRREIEAERKSAGIPETKPEEIPSTVAERIAQQKRWAEQGFYKGPIDGSVGPEHLAAQERERLARAEVAIARARTEREAREAQEAEAARRSGKAQPMDPATGAAGAAVAIGSAIAEWMAETPEQTAARKAALEERNRQYDAELAADRARAEDVSRQAALAQRWGSPDAIPPGKSVFDMLSQGVTPPPDPSFGQRVWEWIKSSIVGDAKAGEMTPEVRARLAAEAEAAGGGAGRFAVPGLAGSVPPDGAAAPGLADLASQIEQALSSGGANIVAQFEAAFASIQSVGPALEAAGVAAGGAIQTGASGAGSQIQSAMAAGGEAAGAAIAAAISNAASAINVNVNHSGPALNQGGSTGATSPIGR